MATDTQTNADLFLRSLEKGKVARFFGIFGEWPVIPIFIIVMMVFVALAADLISPHGPVESVLRARNTPPVWMEGGSRNEKSFDRGTSQTTISVKPSGS